MRLKPVRADCSCRSAAARRSTVDAGRSKGSASSTRFAARAWRCCATWRPVRARGGCLRPAEGGVRGGRRRCCPRVCRSFASTLPRDPRGRARTGAGGGHLGGAVGVMGRPCREARARARPDGARSMSRAGGSSWLRARDASTTRRPKASSLRWSARRAREQRVPVVAVVGQLACGAEVVEELGWSGSGGWSSGGARRPLDGSCATPLEHRASGGMPPPGSNLDLPLRRRSSYPLDYEGVTERAAQVPAKATGARRPNAAGLSASLPAAARPPAGG